MNLTKYRLGDIATVNISGVDKKSKPGEVPVRLCNFVDVYYNWAVTKDLYDSLMEATCRQEEIDAFTLHKGYVAITKDSETRDDIGVACYIADDFDETVVLGYHTALIIPDPEKLDGKYLNALLHTLYFQKYWFNNASGSGQRYTLSETAIEDAPVFLPDITEQRKIGKFFSELDRKIALNRKENATLEAMAKQLYDYWFVQFDFPDANGKPYKSSGGKMVYNETLKREIPEGWEDCTLQDMCEMYQPQNLPTDLLSNDKEFRVYGANGRIGYFDTYNHDDSEIAMSCRGNSCGVINRTMPKSFITSNAMVITMKDKSIHNEFIAQSIRYMNISGAITGSGQPQITRENLQIVKLLKPDQSVLANFSRYITLIVDMIIHNDEETDVLLKQMNNLLPLIMSGQATVN